MAQDNQAVIPEQLNEYRFIKTHRKIPTEKGWPIDPVRFQRLSDGSWYDTVDKREYRVDDIKSGNRQVLYTGDMKSYSYDEMSQHLADEKDSHRQDITYGVLCGHNGLIVLDIDNRELADRCLADPILSSTFTSSSASKGLPHFYYNVADYCRSRNGKDKKKRTAYDLKAKSGYVIGPNSSLWSNGEKKSYAIINPAPIKEISYDDLIAQIAEVCGDDFAMNIHSELDNKYYMTDPATDMIFRNIDCDTILSEYGVDISHNPGDTPFGNSVGKRCLKRTGFLWYDHHNGYGGTVITLYAKIHDKTNIDAFFELAERIGLKQSMMNKYLELQAKNKTADMVDFLTRRFLKLMPVKTIRSSQSSKEMYVYRDGIYIPHAESYIEEFCESLLNKWFTKPMVARVRDYIIAKTYVDSDEFFNGGDIELIPVMNGILNIRTKELIDFTPDKIFLHKHPVKYAPKAKCEKTLEHFDLVLNGPNDVLMMQEWYGYMLYRKYPIHKAMFFYGTGRNGKSLTMKQMSALIGKGTYASISLEELSTNQYIGSELVGKMANLSSEIGNVKIEDTKMFKAITGEDAVTLQRKFLTALITTLYAKMLFCGNELPEISDNSLGFWERWLILGFNKHFIPQEEYDKLQANGTLLPSHRIMDPNLDKVLTSDEELSGVLNWALDGLNRLLERESFTRSDSIDDVKKFWLKKSSSAEAFIVDHIRYNYGFDNEITDDDLLDIYNEYCRLHKVKPVSKARFRATMHNNNFLSRRTTKMSDRNTYVWNNIDIQGYDFVNKRFEKQ